MDNLFRQQMSALATKTEVGLDSELVETKIQKSSIAYSPGRAPANMGARIRAESIRLLSYFRVIIRHTVNELRHCVAGRK